MRRLLLAMLVMVPPACSPEPKAQPTPPPVAAPAPVAKAPPCPELPAPIRSLITAREGWRVLAFGDLTADDKALWMESRPTECPGAVKVVLSKGGEPSWAVALVSGPVAKLQEQLVVFLPTSDGGYRLKVMAPPAHYPFPAVIWKAPPGEYQDLKTGRKLRSDAESFAFEGMEAWAVQHFLVGDDFQSLTISY